MATSWTRADTNSCKKTNCPASINTQTFTYDGTTRGYPTDTVPISLLTGCIDQLVIDGDIPAPNTTVYMPPHTALLSLFKRPKADDQFAIDVTNRGANSIDLTIFKANSQPTGSPDVEYTQPLRIATIPAASVARLYFRVINATPVTGTADVKMLVTPEGGVGSVPFPAMAFDMKAGVTTLLPQQIVQSTGPSDFMFLNGTAAGRVLLPTVPVPTDGPAQLLYPHALTAAPPLVSLVAGDVFEVVLESINQSGFEIEWQTNGISNTTITGSVVQAAGTTFKVVFRFVLAGTAPEFLGTTLNVNLTNRLILNTLYLDPNGDVGIGPTTSTRMAIDTSGNVGIGNNSPSTKLDVNGDIKCDNILSGTFTATGANIVGITAINAGYTAQYNASW